MAVCGRCGEANPARARFCLACGTELAPSDTQARKIVTVLFADVVDSTGLGERLDPEALNAVMGTFFGPAEQAIGSHGGVIEKFVGDAVMAVFGIPQAHEDDALRAVRAAAQLQESIAAMNETRAGSALSIRIGINSGEVLTAAGGEGRAGIIGDAVNAAARLEKLASPGGIVISGATHRLVRGAVESAPMGAVEIRGKSEPIDAYVVVGVDPTSAPASSFEAPMVGRTRELEALKREYERCAEDNVCVLFTLLGPAGIGKSRLIAEATRTSLDSPRVLSGRCLPYGDGITFWPIAEAITGAAHISDRDSQEDAIQKLISLVDGAEDDKLIANLVAQVIGIAEQTASQVEIFWAVRKVLEVLASKGPLVLVFDDLHWAEDPLLDMIEDVVDHAHGVPILVACLARPELLEARPTWAGGKLNATTMLLEPLKDTESQELFAGLLGDTTAIDPLLPRILEVSGGNPLFLEETVAMLADEGSIEKRDGRWEAHTDLEVISIPPTINGLLTSRLDQLSSYDRAVVEVAAVMGKVFASQAVRDLLPNVDSSASFESLSRKGLLRLDQEEFAGEEMYRFRHILIRDAAYQGIPKERRTDIHERYADWLVEALGDRVHEYEEIIAYHLDQAITYQEEISSAANPATRRKAATYVTSAGRRAFMRGDTAATISLLARAASLSEPDDDDLLIRIELAEALIEMGRYEEAKAELALTISKAEALGNDALRTFAGVHMTNLIAETQANVSMEELHDSLLIAIDELERLDFPLGAAQAYRMLSYAFDTLGQSSKGREALEKAISHAMKAGDERRVSSYRRNLIGSLSWSPIPLPDLERETVAFLERSRAESDLRSEARALCILGMTRALQGDIEGGRRYIDQQKAIHDKLDMEVAKAWACFESMWVEIAAEDYERVEAELRWASEVLDGRGERAVLPTVLALLADAECTNGELDEAETTIGRARSMAGEDDVLTQIKWRSAYARVLARRDRGDQAVELAREAVELADSTEYTDWQGMAWMDLAEVLRLAERPGSADAGARASELFRTKGMSVLVERALASGGST